MGCGKRNITVKVDIYKKTVPFCGTVLFMSGECFLADIITKGGLCFPVNRLRLAYYLAYFLSL